MERLRFKKQWFRKGSKWEKRREEKSMRQILAQTRWNHHTQDPHQALGGRSVEWYALGLILWQRAGADRRTSGASHLRHSWIGLLDWSGNEAMEWWWSNYNLTKEDENLSKYCTFGRGTVRFKLVRETWSPMGLGHLKSLPIWGGSWGALVSLTIKSGEQGAPPLMV